MRKFQINFSHSYIVTATNEHEALLQASKLFTYDLTDGVIYWDDNVEEL